MNLIENMHNFLLLFNNNETITVLIIILVSLYLSMYINSMPKFIINLFSSPLFKFLVFVSVSCIAISNPAISMILGITVIVILQLITKINIEEELKSEKFSTTDTNNYKSFDDKINSSDNLNNQFVPIRSDDTNTYLQNPYLMQKELSSFITLYDSKYETPNQLANLMINKGKILLDDSKEMNKDLETKFDSREKEIAFIAARDGNMLVNSGINRLQISNHGEYTALNSDILNKFIKYENTEEIYDKNHPLTPKITELFLKLEVELKKLKQISDKTDFDFQLNNIYKDELELIEIIYKYRKEKINKKNQLLIENKITQIKQIVNNNINFNEDLIELNLLLNNNSI